MSRALSFPRSNSRWATISETVDGVERPVTGAIPAPAHHERARVSGEDPLFNDSQRYIQAALLGCAGVIARHMPGICSGVSLRASRAFRQICRSDQKKRRA